MTVLIPPVLPTFVPRYVSDESTADLFAHLAFVHDLVTELRPSLYVMPGVVSGDSYFGMCQTALQGGLECTCYGVLGSSDENLDRYNATHYGGFSHLLGSGEESIHSFSEGSIDVLHIADDRRAGHTFAAWMPKVRVGGVILVSHIAERDSESEAWRVWEQIENTFPEFFALHHAGGLGLVRKPGGDKCPSPFVNCLFSGPTETREHLRRYYVIYSGYLESVLRRNQAGRASDRKVEEVTTELRAAQHERMILDAELTRTQLELTQMQYQRNEARRRITELEGSIAAVEAAHEATRIQMQQVNDVLRAEQQAKHDLMHSLSWKITAPARDLMEWARRRKAE